MKSVGELTSDKPYKEIVKSPCIYIMDDFILELPRNDVPVSLYYKTGVRPWKSVLINNVFESSMVPKGSEIYLTAHVSRDEVVQYSISY